MWLPKLIFSQVGPYLGLFLVRILPKKTAYWIGKRVVSILVKRPESDLVRSVRVNQAVIRDLDYEDERLPGYVLEVLNNAAYGLVDWFHSIAHPGTLGNLPCSIDDHLVEDVYRAQAEGHGVVIVGAHLSSFNMFLMMIAQRKWPVQILSYHAEQGSHRSDNILRKRFGLNVTPISSNTLRQAIRRLRSGGCVLTGIDRPDTGTESLSFFGRPATMPVGHARLAIRTGARLMVVAVQNAQPGTYHVVGSSLIEAEGSGDDPDNALKLAQRVLDRLERYIRERPSEWMMFVPVWPEALPKLS
jgi:lauroyl/myristoyl acyltransferase